MNLSTTSRTLAPRQDSSDQINQCGKLAKPGKFFFMAREPIRKRWQAHHEMLATTFAFSYLGVIPLYQGQYDQARMLHEQALALWQTAGDTRGVSAALNALEPVALYQGQVEQALSFLKQSLKLRGTWNDWLKLLLTRVSWNEVRADGLRESINCPIFPVERNRYEQSLAEAHSKLDESGWALAHFAGRAMPIEQVVAYALEG